MPEASVNQLSFPDIFVNETGVERVGATEQALTASTPQPRPPVAQLTNGRSTSTAVAADGRNLNESDLRG